MHSIKENKIKIISLSDQDTISIDQVEQFILLRGGDNPQVVYWNGVEPWFLRQVNTQVNHIAGSEWNWFGGRCNNRMSDNYASPQLAIEHIIRVEEGEVMYFDNWREAYQYLLELGKGVGYD